MRCLICLMSLQFCISTASAGEQHPAVVTAPDIDFQVIGDEDRIQHIAIDVEIEGQPLQQVWKATLETLFAFHDLNSDGKLDLEEASHLPSPFALRQMLWNPVSQFPGRISAPQIWDADGAEFINREELIGGYRQKGVGAITFGVGASASATPLTASLLHHLDFDKNGSVSSSEWKQAPKLLEKLDTNSDELLTPDELVPRLSYPGTAGTFHWLRDLPHSQQLPVIQSLPLRLSEQSQENAQNRSLPSLKVNFVEKHAPWSISVEQVQVRIRIDQGTCEARTLTAAAQLWNEFQKADTNRDQSIDREETSLKNQGYLRTLLHVADRNRDERVSSDELETWISLQKELAAAQVLVRILDFHRGLFELLDLNTDGRLSLRELRAAAATVEASGCLSEGTFSAEKLPHQLSVIISRGQPESLLPIAPPDAPAWFLALDRNRDGDVSPREFIGSRESFDQLDRNGDGLISPDETEPSAGL